jgi:AraC-like DNA-binding protein
VGKVSLLWVDLTRSIREAEVPRAFSDHYDVRPYPANAPLGDALLQESPDALCFEFDYPDRMGLRQVQATKLHFPQVPMLMVTLQHSEALAVWAFRTRLWDYLVKPVSRNELQRCANGLLQIRQFQSRQKPREVATPSERLPGDTAATPHVNGERLKPAINYVEKHFREKIHSEDVARLCSMSTFHFSRSFKEAYAIGFREYLVRYRLREACRLLSNPRASVTDVCYAVGFNDHSYFTRMFKRYFDILPSAAVGRNTKLTADVISLPPVAAAPHHHKLT